MIKHVLVFAAIVEIITGIALLIAPSPLGQLLFGVAFTDVVVLVARVTGIALLSLGITCWSGRTLIGMLIYSVLITFYLAYIGYAGVFTGVFLWPVVILHLILSIILIWDAITKVWRR